MGFCTTAIVGYVAIAYVAYVVLSYLKLHFLTTTDYTKYGGKKGGNGSWALVTGSREGIGKGFAIALASRGFNVILIARTEDALKTLAAEIEAKYKVRTLVIAVDASKPDAVQTIVSQVKNLDIGVVVNNVGVNTVLPTVLTETSQADIDQMIAINVAFTTNFTRAMIPILANRKNSLLVMLSSFSGKVPVPLMSVYSATKAYNDVFARALAPELKSSGIDVVSIVPHFVVSAMSGFSRASMTVPEAVPFAHDALNKLSAGFSIAPHWFHDLQTRITPLLPEKFVGAKALGMMKATRAKLIARAEKQKAGSTTSSSRK